MAQILVRNLEDKVKERLKKRARNHGRSMEEEARVILQDAINSPVDARSEYGLGTRIAARFKGIGFTKEEAEALEIRGDPIKPVTFD